MFKKILPYIVCFSAALFFAYELIQLHMMSAIAPLLMQDLNLSATSFGYISATYLLADVLFLLPAGIILDRLQVRKVILSALFICVLGTLGFASATNFVTAAFCHFLSGIGNAFCFLSCMMLVTRWFEEKQQARIMGLIITIGMLGAMIAQSPFSLLAESVGWRQALYIDALVGFVLFIVLYITVRENNVEKARAASSHPPLLPSLKAAITNPVTLRAGLYTSFLNMPLMVISAVFASLFLTQIHKLSLTQSSFIASMIAFGTIFGSPLYGALSDFFQKRRQLMILGSILSSITMFLILFAPTSPAYLGLLFFFLGLCTSSQVLGYPTITENSPKNLQGTSMGIAAVIIMGLPMFVQPLTGMLMDLFWIGELTLTGNRLYPFQSFLAAFSLLPLFFLFAGFLVRNPFTKELTAQSSEQKNFAKSW
ncbi:MAG: MFS transporter [Chlamydiia bacterium]